MAADRDTWSREQTLILLKEYEKYPMLYKRNHPDFNKQDSRKSYLIQLQNYISQFKPNIGVNDIKLKLRTLNRQLAAEQKKILSAGEGYRPTLWCYDELVFLLPDEDEMKSTSNTLLEELLSEEEFIYVSDNVSSVSKESEKHQTKKQRIIIEPHSNPIQISSTETLNPINDFSQRYQPFDNDSSVSKESGNYQTKKQRNIDEPHTNPIRISSAKTLNPINDFSQKYQPPIQQQRTKEESFCDFLCFELKDLQLQESYEEATAAIIKLVREIKANEREMLHEGRCAAIRRATKSISGLR